MAKKKLPNKFKDYWVVKEEEWHKNEVGIYHVSTVGCGHMALKPDEHYGPCLRKTFYDYTDPKEGSLESVGNMQQGTNHHKIIGKIFKKNHPNAILDFPLYDETAAGTQIIKLVGSVDALTMNYVNGNIFIDVYDFKTASDYTLPKDEFDRNPTYFSQLYIYAKKLDKLFGKFCLIRNLIVVYINKHNLTTYEIKLLCKASIAKMRHDDFVMRCKFLDAHIRLNKLPDKEPMRWCKLCTYKTRCDMNLKRDAKPGEYTNDELADIFVKVVGKKAFWGNKETKGFIAWKKGITT